MDKIKKHKMDTQMIIILILVGICAGIMSGLIGVGGGIVIVPALVYILGFSQLDAQGTSLAMIMFPVGILGVMQYYKQGHVDFHIVLILALGFVLGSFIGSKISIYILSQETVKKIFAILMILLAIKMLFFDKKTNPDRFKTKINSRI
jgi:uncharacterized membrane protein YfcA